MAKLGLQDFGREKKKGEQDRASVWDKDRPPEKSSYVWEAEPRVYDGRYSRSKKPTVVELFCGCGGTSVGFAMAGYQIVAGADYLRPAMETFRHNHPKTMAILGDIKKEF